MERSLDFASMSATSPERLAVDEKWEKLRRFVDDWRSSAWETLELFDDSSVPTVSYEVGDVNEDPIGLVTKPHEGATVLDLSATGNLPFNKVMTVLAHDCLQIAQWRQQAKADIYPRLVVFGLRQSLDEVPLEGELQKTFAGSLNFFQELYHVVWKLRAVLRNLVQQLEAIYSEDASTRSNRLFASFWNVHLQTVLLFVGEGFTILTTLDQILAQNPSVGHAFSLFTRVLHSARSCPSDFGLKVEQVESLDQEVNRIADFLLGGLFKTCIKEEFCEHLDMQSLKVNQRCLDQILVCSHVALLQILSRVDTLREYPDDREKMAGLLAVWVFHTWMMGETQHLDRRMVRVVLEVQRRSPVSHLFCNVRFVPLNFLITHLPSWIVSTTFIKAAQKESGLVTSSYLTNLDEALSSHPYSLKSDWASWLVSLDSKVSLTVQQVAVHAILGMRFKQLAQGVFLANRLRHVLRATLDLHAHMEVPINKEQLRSLFRIAEILKALEGMFHRRSSDTASGISHMLHLAQTQIQKRLLHLKAQLEADLQATSRSSTILMLARPFTRSGKESDTKAMDLLAAVNLALKMTDGYPSTQRTVILRLALDVVRSEQSRVPDNTVVEMLDLCSAIEMVANIHNVMKTVTDCSFLYGSKETIPACFRMLYGQGGEARHFQLVINAFKDPIKLLNTGQAEKQVIESYEKRIEDALQYELVGPLCRDVENDLRFHVHSAHLKSALNPTKTGVRDLAWFLLNLKPLKLASKRIDIRSRVESYLIGAFYDHTAVALHDWKTYGEMRQLAELKYRLQLGDIHLPGQTLEQGVDVLEIMRNIHLFVACYTYNSNTQVFIERASIAHRRKYLNTVNTRNVANSIRTHGTGIMNTTINFAYQFLAQKFVVFSQFLFDDHIKSRLIKERRFYKESRSKCSKGYPVGRAQKLNKDIQKLGLTDDGLSFLDQFRQLISEMGNALGFVRMVRLGGLHYCSSASAFVRNVSENGNFEDWLKEAGMSGQQIWAAELLDEALESRKLSVDKMDYFNILTTVFSKELQSNDNLHLEDFFLVVPALTINAVEAMLQSKDRLSKKGRDCTTHMFTDDGFSLGLAYVLKVLRQDKRFDSLHWFDSARDYFTAEKAKIADGLDMDMIGSGMNGLQTWSQKLASTSEEGAQNLQVIKKLSSYLMELELVYFTFSGARIFFR